MKSKNLLSELLSDLQAVVQPQTEQANEPMPKPKEKKSVTAFIMEEQKLRTRQDLLTMRLAVDVAENPSTYDRELLHNIYRDIIIDPNLSSQWESRKMKTKEKPFKVVNAAGEEQPELTKIFEQQWFFDFMDAALDSKQWGFTLIEFGTFDPINVRFLPYLAKTRYYSEYMREYPAINVIDRDYVKPEFGTVVNMSGQINGISFYQEPYASELMFIGKPCDFGWLRNAMKYILFKDNCLSNWSEWAEVFAMDKRIGKTNAQDVERQAFIKNIKNLGSNAYGVFNLNDEVEFVGTPRTDAFQVYAQLIQYTDEQMAKQIFGQDVVTNNTGRVVGTTGEKMADMYGAADARFITAVVNDKLVPFLKKKGFDIGAGNRFIFDTSEKLGLKDRSVVDKTINDMGFKHKTDYINNTYGVEVEEKPEPEPTLPGQGNPNKPPFPNGPESK